MTHECNREKIGPKLGIKSKFGKLIDFLEERVELWVWGQILTQPSTILKYALTRSFLVLLVGIKFGWALMTFVSMKGWKTNVSFQ